MKPINFNRKIVKTKIVFYLTLLVLITIGTIIFLSGPKNIYNDTLTTISVISILIFTMMFLGLYKGITIEDDMDNLVNSYKFNKFFDIVPVSTKEINIELDEGPIGIIFSILAWFLISIIFSLLISLLIASFWYLLILMIMALYWIFYRAVRLVFRKSVICKGNIFESTKYSFFYTVLYTIWFFAIGFAAKIINSAK